MDQLRELDPWSTKVTDAGLEHLKGLKELKTLYLNGTKVTRQGVKDLHKALPNCQISGGPSQAG